jgi:Fur family ferric uptake transcriptional regulator
MENIYSICKHHFAVNDMRFTKQRKALLDTILQLKGHFDADGLFCLVTNMNVDISRTTVYRSLPVFESAGIITQVLQDKKTKCYERAYKKKHHDHLICEKCNKVIEFSSSKVDVIQEEIYKRYNFVPTEHQMILKGICSKCRKGQDGK